MNINRSLCLLPVIALSQLNACTYEAASQNQPNIIFIMSDDHAANAISAYRSRLAEVAPTPNIDQLAREGVMLTNVFCTNSICTPSRATILTGNYSHVTGVYTLQDALDPEEENISKVFQRNGYQTALFGKWHLKRIPSGFDTFKVVPGQGLYHNPLFKDRDNWVDGNDGGIMYKGFSTDLITDFSIEWMEQRDPERPFILFTHFKNAHAPWHFAERHKDLFADVDIPETESLWEDMSHRSEGSRNLGFTISENMVNNLARNNWPTGSLDTAGMSPVEKTKAAYQKYLKDYLRCVRAIDENVGRILAYLETSGLAENTVVIYTSDQGMFLGEHNYMDKRWMYEESLRMPFLVRYPGELDPGTVVDDIIINADFAPFLLDIAGIDIPYDMQGRSFLANLYGDTPDDWRQSMYYRYWLHTEGRPAHYGVRTQNHKLIFFYGLPLGKTGTYSVPTTPGWELYDLKNDPYELQNVYQDPRYSNVVTTLKNELLRLKKELGDEDSRYPEMVRLLGSINN